MKRLTGAHKPPLLVPLFGLRLLSAWLVSALCAPCTKRFSCGSAKRGHKAASSCLKKRHVDRAGKNDGIKRPALYHLLRLRNVRRTCGAAFFPRHQPTAGKKAFFFFTVLGPSPTGPELSFHKYNYIPLGSRFRTRGVVWRNKKKCLLPFPHLVRLNPPGMVATRY